MCQRRVCVLILANTLEKLVNLRMDSVQSITIVEGDKVVQGALERLLRSEFPGLELVFSVDQAAAPGVFMLSDAPFRAGLLLDQVRRYVRSAGRTPVCFGPYVLDSASGVLSEGESQKARLTEKEIAILELLMAAGGASVAREKLLAEVWGYGDNIETHTLETHMYRLRQKIEEDASAPRWIVTREDGYALTGL